MIVSLQIEGLILLPPPPAENRLFRKKPTIEQWGLVSPVVHQIIEAEREGIDVEAFTLLGEDFAEAAEARLARDHTPVEVRFAEDRQVLWEYERNAFLFHRDADLEVGFYVDAPTLFDMHQALTRY